MKYILIKRKECSLPADVLWGSFVTHSFLPHGPWGRNECVTNKPQRTSVGRLLQNIFYIILPDSIPRTPDNSNFFLFPLNVRIIGSRL